MNVLDRLATSLGRRDEVPNEELAEEIVRRRDTEAVKELVANLSNRNKGIGSDCIKTLYEIGERDIELIAPHCREFGKLLASGNNRLVWGAMTALDAITLLRPKEIHAMLPAIAAAADTGSVITRDHAVCILSKLATLKQYAADCVPLLLKQLATCPDNQFPMYVEKSEAAITDSNREKFIAVITDRLETLQQEPKRKRVMKVVKRIAGSGTMR